MANLLLLDTQGNSAESIRNYLFLELGLGCSIATNLTDAVRKLDTGLFDALYVDVSTAETADELRFLEQLRKRFEDLPILRVHDGPVPALPRVFDLGGAPSGADISEAIWRLLAENERIADGRRRFQRASLAMSASLVVGGAQIEACTVNLSPEGAQIELIADPEGDVPPDVEFRVEIGSRELVRSARITHCRYALGEPVRLGLAFTDTTTEEIAELRGLLEAA